MRTRTAAVVAVVATAGLVLSISILWPRLAPGNTVRDEPGPTVVVDTPAPTSPGSSAAPTAPASQVPRTDAALDADRGSAPVRPVRVVLDAVGIDAVVRSVGVTSDAQMQLPPDPRVIGWYEFGPAPGSGAGSVVLAGHLDSFRFGVGPLVRLRDAEVGDPVEVRTSDGAATTYRVVGVERFDRQALPAEIFARTGPERLRIVTCGGDYTPGSGYEQNLVVTAVPG